MSHIPHGKQWTNGTLGPHFGYQTMLSQDAWVVKLRFGWESVNITAGEHVVLIITFYIPTNTLY